LSKENRVLGKIFNNGKEKKVKDKPPYLKHDHDDQDDWAYLLNNEVLDKPCEQEKHTEYCKHVLEFENILVDISQCVDDWKSNPLIEKYQDDFLETLIVLKNKSEQIRSDILKVPIEYFFVYVKESQTEDVLGDRAFFKGIDRCLIEISRSIRSIQASLDLTNAEVFESDHQVDEKSSEHLSESKILPSFPLESEPEPETEPLEISNPQTPFQDYNKPSDQLSTSFFYDDGENFKQEHVEMPVEIKVDDGELASDIKAPDIRKFNEENSVKVEFDEYDKIDIQSAYAQCVDAIHSSEHAEYCSYALNYQSIIEQYQLNKLEDVVENRLSTLQKLKRLDVLMEPFLELDRSIPLTNLDKRMMISGLKELGHSLNSNAVNISHLRAGLEYKMEEFELPSHQEFVFSELLEPIIRESNILAHSLGKSITFKVYGGSLDVSKSIRSDLMILMRLCLRHIIHYRIEPLSERLTQDKESESLIEIGLVEKEGHFQVFCENEGLGVDIDTRIKRFQSQGLISDNDHHHRILSVLLSHDDSSDTASNNDFNLELFFDHIKRLKASLIISTQRFQGTRFLLKLPKPSVNVVVTYFQVDGLYYALPTEHIIQRVTLNESHIEKYNQEPYLKFNDTLYRLYELNQILSSEKTGSALRDDRSHNDQQYILISTEYKNIFLSVDQILKTEEVARLALPETAHGYIHAVSYYCKPKEITQNIVPILDIEKGFGLWYSGCITLNHEILKHQEIEQLRLGRSLHDDSSSEGEKKSQQNTITSVERLNKIVTHSQHGRVAFNRKAALTTKQGEENSELDATLELSSSKNSKSILESSAINVLLIDMIERDCKGLSQYSCESILIDDMGFNNVEFIEKLLLVSHSPHVIVISSDQGNSVNLDMLLALKSNVRYKMIPVIVLVEQISQSLLGRLNLLGVDQVLLKTNASDRLNDTINQLFSSDGHSV
jgi:hypothetical protein